MTSIKIDPATLGTLIQEVETTQVALGSAQSAVAVNAADLGVTWTGDAASAYHTVLDEWNADVNNVGTWLARLGEVLQGFCNTMGITEEEAVAKARSGA